MALPQTENAPVVFFFYGAIYKKRSFRKLGILEGFETNKEN